MYSLMWYGDSSLSGFKVSGNRSGKGGGIHLDSTGITLSDLVVTENRTERGAGKGSKGRSASSRTGDPVHLYLLIAVMIAALIAAAVTIWIRRRKQ